MLTFSSIPFVNVYFNKCSNVYILVRVSNKVLQSNLRVLTLCNINLFAIPLKPSLVEQYFID